MAETLFTLQQKSEDVISYGVDHQQKQYEHAYHLSPFLKSEAEFSAENHLDEQKHGVASVKGRNRQDVHKRQYDADERCQSHAVGNMLPIAPKDPTLFAPSFVNRYLRSLT